MENAKLVLRKSFQLKGVIVDSSACTVDFRVVAIEGLSFSTDITHHQLYKMLEKAEQAEILSGGKEGFVKFNQGAIIFKAYKLEDLK